MYASTFTKGNLFTLYLASFTCFVAILCLPKPTQAQTIRTPTSTPFPPTTTIISTASSTLSTPFTSPTITSNSISSTTTTGRPIVSTSFGPITATPQQPIFFKFTLVAGKFWKFNIKSNSFFNYKDGELRLHRNVSIGNYIIEDDGWFQFNPIQQQLFAWPNLYTKPGTYYFVLSPSRTDVDEDSENVVGQTVAANIVVELIRPLMPNQSSLSDLSQVIDHRFSLEYLHRQSAYPLMLQQIVGVLEAISRSNNNNSLSVKQNYSSTSVAPVTALALLKGQKLTNKLNDYLLINYSYSHDSDLFSITWTTQPSLANNTITQISECRVNTINETVSRLSKLASGFQHEDEKFIIYYPIETLIESSQAIVPTERGNFSLKLSLDGPCQNAKHMDQLGIEIDNNKTENTIADADFRENHIEDLQSTQISTTASLSTSTSATIATSTTTTTTTNPITTPVLPVSEAIDAIAAEIITNLTASSAVSVKQTNSKPAPNIDITENISTTTDPVSTSSVLPTATSSPTSIVDVVSGEPALLPSTATQANTATSVVSTQGPSSSDQSTTEETRIEPAPTQFARDVQANKTAPLDAQVIKFEEPVIGEQKPKTQPQAKSFENFLDIATDATESAMSSTLAPNITTYATISSSSLSPNFSTKDIAQVQSESSLNEDFMGIINEVMDYLVEFAVPISIIIGLILLLCIFIALCNLCMKRRKTKEFKVRDRFSFRYGSERKAFLKNSSKPVILDADQKSISMGGTPQHKLAKKDPKLKKKRTVTSGDSSYHPMSMFTFHDGGAGAIVAGTNGDCSNGGEIGGGDCGGGFGGGDCGGGDFGGGGCDA